jgi:uncharacterized protein
MEFQSASHTPDSPLPSTLRPKGTQDRRGARVNLAAEHRDKLLAIARRSIESGLAALRWVAMPAMDLPASLAVVCGSFVTLRIGTQLRGSSGSLEAAHPLGEEIWRHAWAAAFADPRFEPLDPDDWAAAHIEIAVASSLELLEVRDDEELLHVLRPGIDGLLLESSGTQTTFPPETWESIDNPRDFIAGLRKTAGWRTGSWPSSFTLRRYATESFSEIPASVRTRSTAA